MNVVILAAGVGSRLGKSHPKALTKLKNKNTILQQQIQSIKKNDKKAMIYAIVGFKAYMIMEKFSQLFYIYNGKYAHTNTSKSLLLALKNIKKGGVLWLNGDVVFEADLMENIMPRIKEGKSFVCVNNLQVGEEEIKYTLNAQGNISQISKRVQGALGEAIGINYIASADKKKFIACLEKCKDHDYFEQAMEFAISEEGVEFSAVDISKYTCMEIDFLKDLNAINKKL